MLSWCVLFCGWLFTFGLPFLFVVVVVGCLRDVLSVFHLVFVCFCVVSSSLFVFGKFRDICLS